MSLLKYLIFWGLTALVFALVMAGREKNALQIVVFCLPFTANPYKEIVHVGLNGALIVSYWLSMECTRLLRRSLLTEREAIMPTVRILYYFLFMGLFIAYLNFENTQDIYFFDDTKTESIVTFSVFLAVVVCFLKIIANTDFRLRHTLMLTFCATCFLHLFAFILPYYGYGNLLPDFFIGERKDFSGAYRYAGLLGNYEDIVDYALVVIACSSYFICTGKYVSLAVPAVIACLLIGLLSGTRSFFVVLAVFAVCTSALYARKVGNFKMVIAVLVVGLLAYAVIAFSVPTLAIYDIFERTDDSIYYLLSRQYGEAINRDYAQFVPVLLRHVGLFGKGSYRFAMIEGDAMVTHNLFFNSYALYGVAGLGALVVLFSFSLKRLAGIIRRSTEVGLTIEAIVLFSLIISICLQQMKTSALREMTDVLIFSLPFVFLVLLNREAARVPGAAPAVATLGRTPVRTTGALLIFLACLAGAAHSAGAAVPAAHPGRVESLEGVMEAAGRESQTVELEAGAVYAVDKSLTVPANIDVVWRKGAVVRLGPGSMLTLNGRVEAPPVRLFSGPGRVVFGRGSVEKVYPQWWGGRGDGVTDDTAAVQNAIDALRPAGGTVFFPRAVGYYNITSTLSVPFDNITIEGNGNTFRANRWLSPFDDGHPMWMVGVPYLTFSGRRSNIVMENLDIRGFSRMRAIFFHRVANGRIARCSVVNPRPEGDEYKSRTWLDPIWVKGGEEMTIEDCLIDGSPQWHGITFKGQADAPGEPAAATAACKNWVVRNCTIKNCRGYGVDGHSYPGSAGRIRGCLFINCGALTKNQFGYAIVEGNYFSQDEGMYEFEAPPDIDFMMFSHGAKIVHNTIIARNGRHTPQRTVHIVNEGDHDYLIEGNTVVRKGSGSACTGIFLHGVRARSIIIANNCLSFENMSGQALTGGLAGNNGAIYTGDSVFHPLTITDNDIRVSSVGSYASAIHLSVKDAPTIVRGNRISASFEGGSRHWAVRYTGSGPLTALSHLTGNVIDMASTDPEGAALVEMDGFTNSAYLRLEGNSSAAAYRWRANPAAARDNYFPRATFAAYDK